MKKRYYFLFVFFLIFIIQCKKDYINTIENYLKYLKKGKNRKAYNLLSSKDKSIISFEEYQEDNYSTPISKNISKRVNYRIVDSQLSEMEKYALIKVEINQPDLVKLYSVLPELLNVKYNEKQIDKIFRLNKKNIENNSIKTINEYKLVLENNRWKIFADYEKKRYIYNLIKEADKNYEDNEYNKALAKYEEILEFENNEKVLDRIRILKEKLHYIEKYIKINYNILKKHKNGVIIDIAIKNIGTIVVKKIIIDFLFYNNEIQVYKEKREILENIDQRIGFNKEIRKKVVFEDYTIEFSKIDCMISAIEF